MDSARMDSAMTAPTEREIEEVARAICANRNEGCRCLDRPLCCNGEALNQARAAITALDRAREEVSRPKSR